jgi:protein SCO1
MKRLFFLILLALGMSGSTINAAEQIPNAPLVNQEGKPFQVHDLKGKYVFVTFVFSRCPLPKMCPLTMKKSNSLLREWRDKKIGTPLHVLAVTLDPDNDNPATLKKFGKTHAVDFSRFTLATGNPQVLASFAENFNVMAIPDGKFISHNMKNILIGPDLTELAQYRDNEWQPQQVIQDALAKKTPPTS